MSTPLLYPAPEWSAEQSEFVILWHGCTLEAKDRIEANGIDLSQCAPNTDFGRGFYTTTLKRQAELWAVVQYGIWEEDNPGKSGNPPVVLRLRVRRYTRVPRSGPLDDGLDQLDSLQFVRGDFDALDYWSFVQHCRRSIPGTSVVGTDELVIDHGRPPHGWYQLVSGPVAAFWRQRSIMAGSDQYSFHRDGIDLLNAVITAGKGKGIDGRGDPAYYQWSELPLVEGQS